MSFEPRPHSEIICYQLIELLEKVTLRDVVLVPFRGLFVFNTIRFSPVKMRLCGPFCGAKSKCRCIEYNHFPKT